MHDGTGGCGGVGGVPVAVFDGIFGRRRQVNALAEETGAFTRARKIESPEVLLRLILMWAVAERSLMDTAAAAAEAGLADVSDVALVKRFAKGR